MFDLEEFISRCRRAGTEPEPRTAVREVLEEALADRAGIARVLPPTGAELTTLYDGPEVHVVKVVWGRGMSFPPHDHLTWACNGIYAGVELNALFRREGEAIEPSGALELREGDIGLLGDDAVHAVTNPLSHELSAAIHVYGPGFPALPRSNWLGDPPRRVPVDPELTRRLFAEAGGA